MRRRLIYDKEATRKLLEMREYREWFNKNYNRLKKKYNERYIAILDKGVIDSDPDLHVLLNRLQDTYPEDNKEIIIEHITDKKIIRI